MGKKKRGRNLDLVLGNRIYRLQPFCHGNKLQRGEETVARDGIDIDNSSKRRANVSDFTCTTRTAFFEYEGVGSPAHSHVLFILFRYVVFLSWTEYMGMKIKNKEITFSFLKVRKEKER